MKNNLRASQMFEIVSQRISFKDRTVLDLGCGYGNMSKFALDAGAKLVFGIDHDEEMVKMTAERCRSDKFHGFVRSIDQRTTFDYAMGANNWNKFDIGFFFSVFPYLRSPWDVLVNMNVCCTHCFIEVQYEDDGPGNIAGPETMREWFDAAGFLDIEKIGATLVEDRQLERDIWMCHAERMDETYEG